MEQYNTNKRYCPHELTTKIHAVETYRKTKDISYVCRKYHISKASLMRWNRLYNGSLQSLVPKSHKPHSPHPNSHTQTELKWIIDYHRRSPNISVCELYGKLLHEKGYTRHFGSLYRVFVRLGFRKNVASTKKLSYTPKPYNTPAYLGIKWQMDVKYVPKACYSGLDSDKFYQYTMLDEASRERFIYPYKEHSGYSTIDFVQRAIAYFGYKPKIIQTDNGTEFTYFMLTDREHIFDKLCKHLNIQHKLIRPRTPRHNGKVERSHRNDQERFYNYLKFYSYEDLQKQMQAYLKRSNNIPMKVLGWKSPVMKRVELLSLHPPK